MRTNSRKLAAVTAAFVWAVLLAGPAAAGNKLTARMDEPFEINGKLYAAGSLVVEHLQDYTPSTSLSEVWAGSEFVGVLRADRVAGAGDEESGSLTFLRDARGTLVLFGYGSAAHGEFQFQAVSPVSVPGLVANR